MMAQMRVKAGVRKRGGWGIFGCMDQDIILLLILLLSFIIYFMWKWKKGVKGMFLFKLCVGRVEGWCQGSDESKGRGEEKRDIFGCMDYGIIVITTRHLLLVSARDIVLVRVCLWVRTSIVN